MTMFVGTFVVLIKKQAKLAILECSVEHFPKGTESAQKNWHHVFSESEYITLLISVWCQKLTFDSHRSRFHYTHPCTINIFSFGDTRELTLKQDYVLGNHKTVLSQTYPKNSLNHAQITMPMLYTYSIYIYITTNKSLL